MSNARFSILQAVAVSDRRVSDAQFRTLAALGMYADKLGWCFPSLKTLAADLKKSPQAVGRDTIALRKLGYLEVKNRYDSKTKSRHSNLYRLKYDISDFNVDDTPLSTSEVDTLSTSEVDVNAPKNDPIKVKTKKTQIKGIEAAMFGGREVTQDDIPSNDEALKAFERDLQCPGSWSWYPAKSTDEPAWKSLREFVVTLYQSDAKAFEKYYTWARDPFSRGAKLPIHIRQDPTCFEYAWLAYQAANPGQVNSPSESADGKGFYV